MSETKKLTHVDDAGHLRMVDVGHKAITQRTAHAEGFVLMAAEVMSMLNETAKGNALEAARLAGIMAAKRTHDLIPLCHGLPLDSVQIDFEAQPDQGRVRVTAEARCSAKTGVEMEAMTAVSVACLTLYDMTKAYDKGMVIDGIKLLRKTGGKSGIWQRA
jgi:cyclic pyranopterin phosphate synthase